MYFIEPKLGNYAIASLKKQYKYKPYSSRKTLKESMYYKESTKMSWSVTVVHDS